MIIIINGINTEKGGSGAHLMETWLSSLRRYGKAYYKIDTIPALPGNICSAIRIGFLALYFLPGTLLRIFRLPLLELTYKVSPFLLLKFLRAMRKYEPQQVLFSHHAVFYLSLFVCRERSHFVIHDLLYRRSRSLGFGRRLSKFVFWAERYVYMRAASLLCLSYHEERILRRFGFKRLQLLSSYSLEGEAFYPESYDSRQLAIVSDWRRGENLHGLMTFFLESAITNKLAEGPIIHCNMYGFESTSAGDKLAGLLGAGSRFDARARGSYKDFLDIPEGVFLVPIYQGAGIKIKLLEAIRHRRYVIGTPAAFVGVPRRWLAGVSTVVSSMSDLPGVNVEVDQQAFVLFEEYYRKYFRELGDFDFDDRAGEFLYSLIGAGQKEYTDSSPESIYSECVNGVIEPPSVCFSIVSHEHGPMVGQLLASIANRRLVHPQRDQVIVTLNMPEDESFLASGLSLPMTVLRNESPIGFGANHNAAFAICKSDVFCVLNPDLHLGFLDLRYMLEVLRDPSVGAWAPRVYSPKMTIEDSARKFPTPAVLFQRTFLNRRSLDYEVSNVPFQVDWAAGMFIAFRSGVFATHCGFNESLYMYMEDVDICRRLRRSSLKVIYDPRTAVVHDARRDSKKKLKYLIWHVQSALRYFWDAN